MARAISSLPTPEFALDQHRDVRSRGALAEPDDAAHVVALGDDVPERQRARRAPRHAAHLVLERVEAQRVLDRDRQPLGADRLDHEIERARPHGRDHGLDRAVRGLHDGRDGDLALAHAAPAPPCRRGRASTRSRISRSIGFGPAPRAARAPPRRLDHLGLVAEAAHHGFEQAALNGIVVDDEDCGGHASSAGALFAAVLSHACVDEGKRGLTQGCRSEARRRAVESTRHVPVVTGVCADDDGGHGAPSRDRTAVQDRDDRVHTAATAAALPPRRRSCRQQPRLSATVPRWNLGDLYPAMDAPAFAPISTRPAQDAERFRGAATADSSAALAGERRTPARASPRRSTRSRRSTTCWAASSPIASLLYAGDTSDPARAKFFGDAQERVTADLVGPAVLHARAQPPRRRGARPPAAERAAGALQALARRHPQGPAAPARRPGSSSCSTKSPSPAAPPGTGCSTRPSRPCASRSRGEPLTLEPTLNLLQDADGRRRRARPRQALGRTLRRQPAHLRADHQHARQGPGDRRPLARLRGRRRFAPSRQPGRARGRRRAGHRGRRPPIRACRTATTS